MAKNFKHSGHRLPVASASGTITSGQFVVQEGIFGIALTDAATGEELWLGVEGVWNIAVPASTVKGDYLAVDNAALTADAINPTLTRTAAAGDAIVGIALSARDTAGFADVFLTNQARSVL